MSAHKHHAYNVYTISLRYTWAQYVKPGHGAHAMMELQDARLPQAQCRRGAHALREVSGDDADMLRKQPPGVWRTLLCTNSDGHRAVIGHHQGVGGGKAAHAGDAPQATIDRHGHLDCPHRGREASSSRSVAFPRLGGKKEQRTSVSDYVTPITTTLFVGCAEGAVMRRCPCDVALASHTCVPAERRIQYVF